MRKTLGVLALVVAFVVASAVAHAGAVTIILAGQSNASGAGTVLPQDTLPDAAPIIVMTPESGIRDSREPWRTGGTGAGRSFARYIVANDPTVTQVWMVSCSQGNTVIAQWLPNAADGYMNRCLSLARRAESFGAPVVAVLWMHGETDSARLTTANMYGGRLPRVVSGFRTGIGRPVAFLVSELPINVPAGKMLYRSIVMEATETALAQIPNTTCVSTADLTQMREGQVHFDRPALRAIGTRFGAALLGLVPAGLGYAPGSN